jgi:FdhD protein
MVERIAELAAQRFTSTQRAPISESVAIEEPLEIRINQTVFAITMRTPGDDVALVHGLLFSEGVIQNIHDIETVEYEEGTIEITLSPNIDWDPKSHKRAFNRTSSCGICGRASLEAVLAAEPPTINISSPIISKEIIDGFSAALSRAQQDFDSTGGMHAVARFSANGSLIDIGEDVGRHNAMDKVVGRAILAENIPLSEDVMMLSGRVSFEMVQKAVMAGCPIIAAIGAPTTLAVDLARQHGLTLIGFLRDGRFNVYSGANRIRVK